MGQRARKFCSSSAIQTLLSATGDSVVESYVAIAKQEAQKQAKEAGGGMAAIREAVEKAEAETRAKYEGGAAADTLSVDTADLSAAVAVYTDAVKAYAEVEAAARSAYEEAHYAEAEAALEQKHEEMLEAGEEVPEDDEVVVDMSGFEPTEEMTEQSRKRQRQPMRR